MKSSGEFHNSHGCQDAENLVVLDFDCLPNETLQLSLGPIHIGSKIDCRKNWKASHTKFLTSLPGVTISLT